MTTTERRVKKRAATRRWEKKYPEKKQAQNSRHYHRHRDRIRLQQNCRKYGITPVEYDALFVKQEGRCALCGADADNLSRRLAIDHSHKTDRVRALLCGACNAGIALFADDIELLKKAIIYLETH